MGRRGGPNWRRRVVAGLLLAALLAAIPTSLAESEQDTAPTSASDDEGIMQGADARSMTVQRSTLFLYGEGFIDVRWQDWEVWNHASRNTDQGSASLSESTSVATPGNPNSQGGSRDFIFRYRVPIEQQLVVDPDAPINGTVTLQHTCSSTCDRSLTVIVAYNGRESIRVTKQTPDDPDNNLYYFDINHNFPETFDPDDTLDIRLQFTKPNSFNDGYTLSLGPGFSEFTFPVEEPRQPLVPGLEFEEGDAYVSPYADRDSGFTHKDVYQAGWFGLVALGILSLILGAGGVWAVVAFAPPMSLFLREFPVVLLALTMLTSVTIIPMWHGPLDISTAVDLNDPKVVTVEDLATSPEQEGTFLGFAAGESFTLWVEYDEVYYQRIGGTEVFGLSFADEGSILSDPEEASWWAKQFLQYYFSLLSMDIRDGSGVAINVRLVTDSITGEVVPQWADSGNLNNSRVDLGAQFGERWVVPAEDSGTSKAVIVNFGHAAPYQWYPFLAGSGVSLLLGGVGVFLLWRSGAFSGGGAGFGVADYGRDAFYEPRSSRRRR